MEVLRPKRQSSQTFTVTAPIGGWNAINQLAAMPSNDAVIIDNWFCLPTELQSRKGYTQWLAVGVLGKFESFIVYRGQDGSQFIFAVSNTGTMWDISTKGGVPSGVFTGLLNARWKYAQVSTSGGTFTVAVNGADNLKLFNGTTWYTVTGASTPYAITGVSTALLSDVILHHRRAWFVQKNSMKCWYLGIDSIAGAANPYDFAPLFKLGGSIAKIETWSLDAGAGMDDYFVVITTTGEIAVFSGTDPSSASTWSLNGVYFCGSPIGGANCTLKYGGDVLLLNKDGLVPLSQWLLSSQVNVKDSISNKIQQKISDATSQYASNYGWQVVLNPPQNMLFVNVPISATESEQYVMNTISGAWSRFTGVNATCWLFVGDNLLFAKEGKIYNFWDGNNDDGAIIATDLLPAFSSFGGTSQIKRFTMARVSMGYDYSFSFSGKINVDFDISTQPEQPYNALNDASAGLWDVSLWGEPVWGGDITAFSRWQMASGMGYYGSFRIKTSTKNSSVRYYATDYVLEGGGVL
jgi:hypothetical protein